MTPRIPLRLLPILWVLFFVSPSNAERLCVDTSITADSGTLQDSGGSGSNYSNNEYCGSVIRSSSGGAITLGFSSFRYESGYDYLRIYDGTTTSGTLLLNHTGNSTPSDVTAPSGSMLIVSYTDNIITDAGFEAKWSSAASGTFRMCSHSSSTADSGTLTDSGGSSADYSSNESCTFRIQPADGGDVTLSFGSFRYENGYDYLRVYDGTSTSGTLLGSFTGSSLPSDLTATSGAMFIWSYSDNIVSEDGFVAKWSTTPGNACPDQYVADHLPSLSYGLDAGTQLWSNDWQEIGERDGPSSGISRVNNANCSSGYCLRIGQPSTASSWSNIGVSREADLSAATTATLTFNTRTGYAQGKEVVDLAVSNDGGATWTTLATYSVSSTSYTGVAHSFDISKYIASNTQIRFLSSGSSARAGLYVDDIEIRHDGLAPSCSSGDPDHFDIVHDNSGIHCVDEEVGIVARNADDTTTTDYVGTVTLDTQTGTGSWSLLTGNGTLTDATAGDGIATYDFDASDKGEATFHLSYKSGVAAVDVDVTDGSITDDDSEGTLTFSASGFTVTASALANPPPVTINDPVGNQTAGTAFPLFVTAFGTTPTDSECGVIESYDGARTLSLGTDYYDPGTGSRVASGGGAVTFTAGQAQIAAKYKDAGRIGLTVSDGTLSGGTGTFVVKPARLQLVLGGSNQTAANENGTIYTQAGQPFTVEVTAQDSEGDTTPNFGNEAAVDTIQLTHSLVAPSGGSLGSLLGNLSRTGQGVFSGSASWSEVGIIDLTADLGDNDYLGTGNLIVTQSNLGRFVPQGFALSGLNGGSFQAANQCTGSGGDDFTYSGQTFGYGVAPDFIATAISATGSATTNYTGVFAKLTTSSPDVPELTADGTALGSDGSTPLPVTHTQGTLTLTDNGDGSHTYRFGADSFTYDRSLLAQVGSFASDLDLTIRSVQDGDSIQSNYTTANVLSPASTPIRYGRYAVSNALGSELVDLVMPIQLEVFDAGLSDFVTHGADTCTPFPAATLTDVDAGDLLDATSLSSTVSGNLGGRYELTLGAPGAGSVGAALITLNAPLHLEYPWGEATDPDPSGVGSFGLYAGDSEIIYQRAVY